MLNRAYRQTIAFAKQAPPTVFTYVISLAMLLPWTLGPPSCPPSVLSTQIITELTILNRHNELANRLQLPIMTRIKEK
jgi:hypothetical protein